MERDLAVSKLHDLIGKDLHDLARFYGITVLSNNGTVNKGWAGHVCERYLGIPINSAQSPNFGSWELKSIPLKRFKNGRIGFKETMAITMIDPYHVIHTDFKDSHLLSKLRKAVCVARIVGQSYDEPTFIHSVNMIDLDQDMYLAIEQDYETVRECLKDLNRGFNILTGKMGVFVQPRTKGKGHGSISRAFYARKNFLAHYISVDTAE